MDSFEVDEGEAPEDGEGGEEEEGFVFCEGGIDEVGGGPCDEEEHAGVPDHGIDPLEPDSEEAGAGAEGVADPVKNAALGGKAGGKFCGDKGNGDEKKEGCEEAVEDEGASEKSGGGEIANAVNSGDDEEDEGKEGDFH